MIKNLMKYVANLCIYHCYAATLFLAERVNGTMQIRNGHAETKYYKVLFSSACREVTSILSSDAQCRADI